MSFLLTITLLFSPLSPTNTPDELTPLIHELSCIVGGEAGQWDAQVFVATQLLHDLERGVVLRDRWYGWRCGVPQAERAVWYALGSFPLYGCCRFIGYSRDVTTWTERGYLDAGAVPDWSSGGVVAFGCEP